MPTADVLILTNGPGEVATWVRPVVAQLHTLWGSALRISVVLSPCPHSTGAETHILQQMPGVARVQAAKDFWPFLLWGRTAQGWDWLPRGVVLFLGGDPFYSLVCGRRLGYATLAYAEVQVRWPGWFTALALAKKHLLTQVPQPYRSRAKVVGDLMVAAAAEATPTPRLGHLGLLPGSKPNKLTQGVPFCLTVAAGLFERDPARDVCPACGSDVDPANLGSLCRPPAQSPHFPVGLAVGHPGANRSRPLLCPEEWPAGAVGAGVSSL
jgi:hypothetical protein